MEFITQEEDKMGQEYWNGAEAAHRRVMMKAAGYSDEVVCSL